MGRLHQHTATKQRLCRYSTQPTSLNFTLALPRTDRLLDAWSCHTADGPRRPSMLRLQSSALHFGWFGLAGFRRASLLGEQFSIKHSQSLATLPCASHVQKHSKCPSDCRVARLVSRSSMQ